MRPRLPAHLALTALAHQYRVRRGSAENSPGRPHATERAILRLFSLLQKPTMHCKPQQRLRRPVRTLDAPCGIPGVKAPELFCTARVITAPIDQFNQTLLVNLAPHNDLVLLPL